MFRDDTRAVRGKRDRKEIYTFWTNRAGGFESRKLSELNFRLGTGAHEKISLMSQMNIKVINEIVRRGRNSN